MLTNKKTYLLLVSFFYLSIYTILAQDQRIADGLANIYKADTLVGITKLELLKNLSFNEVNNYKLSLKYADELISQSLEDDNNTYLAQGYFQKGNANKLMGHLEDALAAYFKSAEVAKKENQVSIKGSAYGTIADIYTISNNHKNAMLYYNKAIATLRKSEDTIALASVILNAGDALLTNKEYDSAMVYFKESGKIFEQINHAIGKAYNLGNIGMVYASTGKKDLAEKNINEAIGILKESGDYYPISVYLMAMSDIYLDRGEQQTALNYVQRSLQLAQQYGLKEQISDANLKLSELYEKMGNATESLKHYKDFVSYRDSVNNIQEVQSMADMRTDFEVSQKQTEVDLLNQQKRNQLIVIGFTLLLLLTLFWYYRTISKEKKRSENLLLNILPSEIASELKQKGEVEAVKLEEVTVLFTDFVQFSKTSRQVDPEHLVKSIDFYFKQFDEIITKYGMEKIKTIGDAYMCACGLPSPVPDHAKKVIRAAKEMTAMVKETLDLEDGLSHFKVRVGVHTGPVVAGIVGIKKWQYDIWGDTVNIAARMESGSEPNRINLSETTYKAIKDEFPCEYRGKIEVKNSGLLKMYFLS